MADSQRSLFADADDADAPPSAGPYGDGRPTKRERRKAAANRVVVAAAPAAEAPRCGGVTGPCAWPGCCAMVLERQYLCVDHWYMPPYDLYAAAVQACGPGEPSAELVAARAAIRAWIDADRGRR